MKFLFKIPGRPIVFGHRKGQFIWVEQYQAYIYKGTPVRPKEFNEVFKHVFNFCRDESPSVVLIDDVELTPEELVSEAITTLRMFAPDALKKTVRGRVLAES